LLLAAFPVLLITLSRGAIIAFAVSLIALGFLSRDRIRTALLLLGVVLIAGGFAVTAGQSQTNFIITRYTLYSQGGNPSNELLSGRQTIWNSAIDYLNGDPNRWAVGGGLDDFKRYE